MLACGIYGFSALIRYTFLLVDIADWLFAFAQVLSLSSLPPKMPPTIITHDRTHVQTTLIRTFDKNTMM